MSKYHQIVEGEWVPVPKRGHHNMCCDCAMVHVLDYRVVDGQIEVRFRVNRRATAAARRAFKFTKDD